MKSSSNSVVAFLSLSSLVGAANLRASHVVSSSSVGKAVAYFAVPQDDGAVEAFDMSQQEQGHALHAERMNEEHYPQGQQDYKNSHERHLAQGECGIYAQRNFYQLDPGYCYYLVDTWWNDRVSHIRASTDTCITVYENQDGGDSREHCGGGWVTLDALAGKVSKVCCSETTTNDSASDSGTSSSSGADSSATTSSSGTSTGGSSSCGSSSETGDLFQLTNQYRTSNGRGTVSCNADMSNVIQSYLQSMCDDDASLSHTFGGTTIGGRLTSAGINWSYVSENLAYGTHTDTADKPMNMWKESTGHNNNLLSSSPNSIGVGYVDCSNGYHFWGQVFADI